MPNCSSNLDSRDYHMTNNISEAVRLCDTTVLAALQTANSWRSSSISLIQYLSIISAKMMCGSAKPAEPASADTQAICDKVRSELEEKAGRQFLEYTAISVSRQLVAGTNHFVKLHIGNEEYIHVRIYEPLPHAKEDPSVHSFQLGKSKQEEVGYF